MKEEDLRSILYHSIVTIITNARHENGEKAETQIDDRYSFRLGYQLRPDERFNHNYQRNKFLRNRDKYVVSRVNVTAHMATIAHDDTVTLYRRSFDTIFGKDGTKAVEILADILDGLFDSVRIEEVSRVVGFDRNEAGREGYTENFYAIQ